MNPVGINRKPPLWADQLSITYIRVTREEPTRERVSAFQPQFIRILPCDCVFTLIHKYTIHTILICVESD